MMDLGDGVAASSAQQIGDDSIDGDRDGDGSIDGDRDERVAAAADRLGDVESAPLHEQAEIYAEVYARLNSAMVEVKAD